MSMSQLTLRGRKKKKRERKGKGRNNSKKKSVYTTQSTNSQNTQRHQQEALPQQTPQYLFSFKAALVRTDFKTKKHTHSYTPTKSYKPNENTDSKHYAYVCAHRHTATEPFQAVLNKMQVILRLFPDNSCDEDPKVQEH